MKPSNQKHRRVFDGLQNQQKKRDFTKQYVRPISLLRVGIYLFVCLIFCSLVGLGMFGARTASATAGINQQMSFQGKIVTSAGQNIPDGTYNMEFRIYTGCSNEPTSSTGCTAVWSEDYLKNNSQGVTFTSGTYQVNLGSICAFTTSTCENNSNTAVDWNSYPLYLSLQIGNTSNCSAGNPGSALFTADCGGDGVMNPFVLLTSTPYAFNSNELGGLTASQFGQLSATQTWTGANTIQDSATNAFVVQDASSNKMLAVTTSGTYSVGVGATGSTAIASTVNLGTSTGAAQTVTLGSTASSSTTTVQGGTSGVAITTGAGSGTTGSISITTGNSSGGTSGSITIDAGTNVPSGTLVGSKTFETGRPDSGLEDMTCWFGSCSTVATSSAQAHQGSKSLAMTESGGGSWGMAENYPGDTTVTPGHTYVFTAWVRGTTAEDIDVEMVWTGISSVVLDDKTDSTSAWTEWSGTFVAPAGATNVYFTFRGTGGGTTDYFDDFTVTDISSTTTPAINIGTTNAEAVSIGNSSQSAATTLMGGAGGVNIVAGSGAGINVGTSSDNIVTIGDASANWPITLQGNGISQTLTGDDTTPSDVIKTSTNSTSAFQVQNSSGTSMLNVDTTGGQINLGIAQGGILGNNAQYTPDTGDDYTGLIVGNKFTTGASAENITSMSVYINNPVQTSGGHNHFQLGIYTNSGGNLPQTKVASSSATTVTGNAWNTVPITATLSGSTTYWLAYTTDVSTTGNNTLDTNNVGTNTYAFGTFSCSTSCATAMPSTFPSATASNHNISIYATFSGTGPALTVGSNGSVGVGTGTGDPTANLQVLTTTNTTTAFQVQNASGTGVLTADTSNGLVSLGTANSLNGKLVLNNSSNTNTVSILSGATSSSYTLTMPTALGSSGNCLSDTTGAGVLGWATCGGSGGANTALSNLASVAINTDLQFDNTGNRTVNIAATGAGTTGRNLTVQAGNSGSGAVNGGNLTLQAGASGGSGTTGSVIVKANGTDSATAFQVQNASGNSVLTADTSNGQVALGKASSVNGKLVLNDSSNSNTVTIVSGVTSSTYALTMPTALGASGSCLSDTTGTGVLGWATCGGGGGGANTALSNLASVAINTDLQFANSGNRTINIAAAGASTAGKNLTVQAGNSGTGAVNGGNLVLQAGATGGSGTTGSVIVKANGTDSTTAFQVQTSGGTNLLNVDTSNQQTNVGQNSSSVITPTFNVVQSGAGDATIALQNASGSTSAFYIGNDTSNSNALSINSNYSATYAGAPSSIGYSAGNAPDSNGAMIQGSKFTATATGTVTSMTVDFDDWGSSSDKFAVAVYADSSGIPGTLLGYSGLQTMTLPNGVGNHNVNTITLSNPAPVTSGVAYWFVFNTDSGDEFLGKATGGPSSCWYSTAVTNNGSWSSGPPSSGAPTVGCTLNITASITPSGSLTDINQNSLFTLSQSGAANFRNVSNSTSALQIQNASSANEISVDTTNDRVIIGTGSTGESTAKILVLDNGNTSTDPTGVNGAMYYNSALNVYRCYNNGAWSDCASEPIDQHYEINEEFLTGQLAIGATMAIGNNNWDYSTMGGTACANMSYAGGTGGAAVSASRPGILDMTTGAASSTGCRIRLAGNASSLTAANGMFIGAGQDIKAAVAVDSASTNTVATRVGMEVNSGTAARSTTGGVWWEADRTNNSHWEYCYDNSSNAAVCAASGTTIAANTFVRVEIQVVSATAVNFIINGTITSLTGITLATGTAVAPNIMCENSGTGAVAHSCFADYYQLRGDETSLR